MIRPFITNDTEAVLELLRRNTPTYFAPSEEEDLREYLHHHREDYYVYSQGNQILGAAGINYERPERRAVLSWDIVHPDSHQQGIGSALVQFRIDHIRQDPLFSHIIVRTSQHTYRFYEKMGFVLQYSTKDYWAPGIDLCYMELQLSAL